MSTPIGPRREHPSTYFIQGHVPEDELTRLQAQDQILTSGMGGVLPEQPDATIFQRVLDVGCGTGGWLIEVAKTYPTMTRLIGVDVNEKMLVYARTLAEEEQVSDRVEFRAMDALRMLEFPTDSFDLVNQRLGMSYLRKWDWPKLLHEFQRVTRPGGVIRITESDVIVESSSPALLRLTSLLQQALQQGGHLFAPAWNGVTSELARVMYQYGVQNVQTRAYTIHYHAGTVEGELFYKDMENLFRTSVPFIRKWARLPDDYNEIYQQALKEMKQPDFTATWHLLTAWGTTLLQ